MSLASVVGEWDVEHKITDIVLLGKDGAVRRIVLEDDLEW